MTKSNNGKVAGGLNGGGDAEFYVFAMPEGCSTPLLEHVIYKAANERTARGLCEMFRKRTERAAAGTSFRHVAVLSFRVEDQMDLDYLLDLLDGYGHPNPDVYAVKPSAEVMWRAQCAASARKWDRRLREKLKVEEALRMQAVVMDLVAGATTSPTGRALSAEEKLQATLQLLTTLAQHQANPPVNGTAAGAVIGDGRIKIGRLSYLPGFKQVWLGEELFDLSRRGQARACLRYMVEHRAFDADSARHLVEEIDPFVREECQLPELPGYREFKIHHYFNPSKSDTARLGRELIRPAGRNKRYYLSVN